MDIFKYTRLVEARAKAEKCKTNHLVKEMAINVVKYIEVRAVSDYFIELVTEESFKQGSVNTIWKESEMDPSIKRTIQENLENERETAKAMLAQLDAVEIR